MDDSALLANYVRTGSQADFAILVKRHANWVHTVCRRHAGDNLADDVAQAVFATLARKAARLRPGTSIPGWLFKTARYASATAVKIERRRCVHERKAAAMNPTQTPPPVSQDWEQILPHLDDAVAHLRERDRRAVLLRFYQGLSHKDAAAVLGISPAAAQRCLSRAVEELRVRLQRFHFVVLPGAFEHALQNHLITAAPAHVVAASISTGVAAPSAQAALIMKGALVMKQMNRIKFASVVVGLTAITGTGAWYAVATSVSSPASNTAAMPSDGAPPATAPATLPTTPKSAAGLIGRWTGASHIVVNWTQARTLAVQLEIHADGSVTGTVGDATLKNGVLGTTHPFGLVFGVPESSHGTPPASLGEGDHFQVTANLDGPLIAAEQVNRDGVIIVFSLMRDQDLNGGLASTGTEFGGKDSMKLTAQKLVLQRE